MADNQFVSYAADKNTRWDTIAQWAYGNAFMIQPIMAANPTLIMEQSVPAGTTVIVPIFDDTASGQLPASQKPPWAD